MCEKDEDKEEKRKKKAWKLEKQMRADNILPSNERDEGDQSVGQGGIFFREEIL
jgi:hypothetical protein